VNDHIGITVEDLDEALRVFTENGVAILAGAKDYTDSMRHAFVVGPDNIAIELLETFDPKNSGNTGP
tara:strand:- start:26373 stop:26573 length:201 start_codon:yes stop_codon:yes gene_type:complete